MHKFLVVALMLTAAIATSAGAASKTTKRKHAQAGPNPNAVPAEALAAMKTIDAERIRAHVKFLADDLLEGRGTGQRGGDLAAAYIATQFALDGLKPAGERRQLSAAGAAGRRQHPARDQLRHRARARRRPSTCGFSKTTSPPTNRSSRPATSTPPSSLSATASTPRNTSGTTTRAWTCTARCC